jgi:hypothetical protein
MRRDAAHLALILAAGTLFGACVAPPDALTSPSSDGAEPPTRVQELIGGCDEFLCGANGPMIGGVPFWEIDANPVLPLADAGGLTIARSSVLPAWRASSWSMARRSPWWRRGSRR